MSVSVRRTRRRRVVVGAAVVLVLTLTGLLLGRQILSSLGGGSSSTAFFFFEEVVDEDQRKSSSSSTTTTRTTTTRTPSSKQKNSANNKNEGLQLSFLGMDLEFVSSANSSSSSSVVHCVGENFLPKLSIGYRSCQFRHLCWDLATKDFVIVQSLQNNHTANLLRNLMMESSSSRRYARTSFDFQTRVSLKGTDETFLRRRRQQQQKQGDDPIGWFPRTVYNNNNDNDSSNGGGDGYYQLPNDVIIIPVEFPPNTMQPKDILFDFLLPIYNLKSMFGLQDKKVVLANLGGGGSEASSSCLSSSSSSSLPSSNVSSDTKTLVEDGCYRTVEGVMMDFISLLMKNDNDDDDDNHSNKDKNKERTIPPILTRESKIVRLVGGSGSGREEQPVVTQQQQIQLQSNRICSIYGAAGIGALTDHGIHKKSHGERRKDYTFVRNSGRGPLLYDFRNHILNNLNYLQRATTTTTERESNKNNPLPLRITISISESKKSGPQSFSKELDAIQERFQHDQQQQDLINIQSYNMSNLSLREQLKVASTSNIYISMMGNGAYPAFFMPRGSTLILYYNNNNEYVSGVSKQREVAFPIKLDWDLWNNLSYLRVHWLPLNSSIALHDDDDVTSLIDIIQAEINAIKDLTSDKDQEEEEEKKDMGGTDTSPVVESQQSGQQQHQQQPDGLFNGMPVRFVPHHGNDNNNNNMNKKKSSRAHCIGDNFQERAHVLRSCEYRHLCLDLSNNKKNSSQRHFSLVDLPSSSSSGPEKRMMMSVSLGQTIRFSEDSAWSPLLHSSTTNVTTTTTTTTSEGYYELDDDVVWIPFYAEQPNIHNPGHLLWDYFLPFFNLLVMFGLEKLPLLVTNVDDLCNDDAGGKSNSRSSSSNPCWRIITKFLPLIGVDPATFRSTANSELIITTRTGGPRRSDLVCAKHAVAGIGMLTDHGWNRHGQRIEDYRDSHNVGRGPLFFAFRNYVVRSMGIVEDDKANNNVQQQPPPYKVVFSTHSSKNPSRRLGFQKQIQALRASFSGNDIVVEEHILAELSLEQQVKLATETSVFVSVVGGSACTATFLPRGASVVLYFNDVNEFADHALRKDFPSMIDWDFWNNASYLRVHWLPIRTMDEDIDVQVLTEIIRSDLLTIKSLR